MDLSRTCPGAPPMKLTAATLQTLTLPPGMREKKYFDER